MQQDASNNNNILSGKNTIQSYFILMALLFILDINLFDVKVSPQAEFLHVNSWNTEEICQKPQKKSGVDYINSVRWHFFPI